VIGHRDIHRIFVMSRRKLCRLIHWHKFRGGKGSVCDPLDGLAQTKTCAGEGSPSTECRNVACVRPGSQPTVGRVAKRRGRRCSEAEAASPIQFPAAIGLARGNCELERLF